MNTKKETVKMLRDVLCGISWYTHIGINRIKRGKYEVEIGCENFHMDCNFRHCCNDSTLASAGAMLDAEL